MAAKSQRKTRENKTAQTDAAVPESDVETNNSGDQTSVETPSKETEPKKPGVIASIVEFLNAASSENPVSKQTLVEKLKDRFPEREMDAMKGTVNVQVPNRLKANGHDVQKNQDGYWIES